MQVWIGLALAMISAVAINWAYAREHDAASGLPPLSPLRPLRSAKILVGERRWLVGFGVECVGWLIYLAALRRLLKVTPVNTTELRRRLADRGVACGGYIF